MYIYKQQKKRISEKKAGTLDLTWQNLLMKEKLLFFFKYLNNNKKIRFVFLKYSFIWKLKYVCCFYNYMKKLFCLSSAGYLTWFNWQLGSAVKSPCCMTQNVHTIRAHTSEISGSLHT